MRGAVSLEDVVVRYGDVTAVDRLSLAIEPGEFVSLLGPSGCGKTSTLRVIAGFESADSGVVRLSGDDVRGVPPHRRDVNTVFQQYALFPHLSVAENVAFGLRRARVPKEDVGPRVATALDMVRLRPLAGRKPAQLSGGQQQRVAVARALVNEPAVLLLDEPLGSLDRALRAELQVELQVLHEKVGATFVYVTHDQEEALAMSDRIAVLLNGRLQQIGTPDDVYDRPVNAFVAGFLGGHVFLPGTAGPGADRVLGDGWVVRGTAGPDAAVPGGDAVAAVRPEAVELLDAPVEGGGLNSMPGTVAAVSHLGETRLHVVHLDAGVELHSRRPRGAAASRRPGDRVWCTWPAESTFVFRQP